MKFEERMKRLEQIVQQMDTNDMELDKALTFFEEGIRLSKECQGELQKAEQKVQVLLGIDENGQPLQEDLKITDSDRT